MPSSLLSATPSTRRARRRADTRARLIDGARHVVATAGLARLTIAEVTERADVGFGTFYGYFDSKDDLTRAAVADTLELLGRENDVLVADLTDPAEVMAAAIRHTLEVVHREPAWGRFIVDVAFSSERSIWAELGERVRRDLQSGIAAKRFTITDVTTACALVCGAVLAGARARLDGELAPSADAEIAVRVLVMLGVPDAEANAIVRRPLRPPS